MAAFAVPLVGAALLPCFVGFSPQVYFDVDPRGPAGVGPITVLGPAPQAWLYAGVLALAAAALAVHAALGGRIHWLSVALAATGAAVTAVHVVTGNATDLLKGSAWLAAAALGVAALHLSAHGLVRRLVVAAMVAAAIPLAIDAAMYVWFDHPATVESFRAGEAAFLQSRGWSEGSPQHLAYVRRLSFADAVGAFGLSNVLGNIAAAMTLAAAAVAAGAWRCAPRRLVLVAVPCALAGATVVYLTRSKGSAGALALGVGLLAASLLTRRRPLLRGLALLVLLAPVIAVLVRGAMGPPSDHTGERSLLFRYQYWQAVARIVEGAPILGVGPGGFKDAYVVAKHPLNPEEVSSSHNLFLDWLAMLGFGGVAWSTLVLLWLWRASPTSDAASGPVTVPRPGSAQTLSVAAIAGLVFLTQYVLELPQMWAGTAVLWIAGVVLFIGAAATVASLPREDRRVPSLALFVAAATLLCQSQIEMTFDQAGAALTAWFVVGAAAGAGATFEASSRRRWPGIVLAVALFLAALALAGAVAVPQQRQQSRLSAAARLLQAGHVPAAIERLDEAARFMPRDPEAARWAAQLLLEAAARQAGRDPDAAARALETAINRLEQEVAAGRDDSGTLRMLSQAHRLAAEAFDRPAALAESLRWQRRVVAANPYSIQDRLVLADLLWRSEQRGQAAAEYQRIVKLDEQAYLDPIRRLNERDRALVMERLR